MKNYAHNQLTMNLNSLLYNFTVRALFSNVTATTVKFVLIVNENVAYRLYLDKNAHLAMLPMCSLQDDG